jgi:hypothetical protein
VAAPWGSAPFFAPFACASPGPAAAMAGETCRGHRRATIVGEGPADRPTRAAAHLGFRVAAGCDGPCQRAHTTDALVECLVGMAIGCRDGLGRLAEGMTVAQVMGPWRQGVVPSLPAGALASTDDRDHGHTQGLVHAAHQRGEGGGARGHQAGARRTSPARQARRPHRTSGPPSGCQPSRAKTTRPGAWGRRGRRSVSWRVRLRSASERATSLVTVRWATVPPWSSTA